MLAIDLHDVFAGYGGKEVLYSVSLSVFPGTLLGIIGPNGAGKTTLLRVLGGALPFSAGGLRIHDKDIRSFSRLKQTVDVTDECEAKRASSGVLALQLHAGPPMTAQFRNIRLKRL